MKTYQKIIACGLLAAAVIGSYISCKNKEEQPVQIGIEETIAVEQDKEEQPVQIGIEETIAIEYEKIIIQGTFSYDVDSMRYGASREDNDIFWSHKNETKRKLKPRNGAEAVNLGQVDFDAVTLKDLIAAQYSKEGISGDDDNNQLTPGTVIGIKTNQDNYAKLRIDGYLPYKSSRSQKLYTNYHLQCTLFVFPQETNPTVEFF